MRTSAIAMMVIAVCAPSHAQAADISNKELQEACAKKTIVLGHDLDKTLVRAGEKLDGFCSGYLQASFNAYANSAACQAKDVDPNFLLSVYQQYLKDKKVPGSASASKTLMQAFRRAPECKK
jgi:hypothetical protein